MDCSASCARALRRLWADHRTVASYLPQGSVHLFVAAFPQRLARSRIRLADGHPADGYIHPTSGDRRGALSLGLLPAGRPGCRRFSWFVEIQEGHARDGQEHHLRRTRRHTLLEYLEPCLFGLINTKRERL